MMKKLWIFFFLASFMACQMGNQQEGYTLKGNLEGASDQWVYLQDRISGQMVTIDSSFIEEQTFTINGLQENPEMFYLSFEEIPGRFPVFLENAEITITFNAEDPSDYNIEGSSSHDIYTESNKIREPYNERLRAIQQEMIAAEVTRDDELMAELNQKAIATERELRKETEAFLANHSNQSAGAFIAMRTLTHGLDYEEMKEVLNIFDPSLAGTRYYDDLSERVDKLEKVAVGNPAVDFTSVTPSGEELSLSDFRGKYVLINFWASWCPYCREENPHLVNTYNTLPTDNFEILSVSLDREKDAWEKGIEDDQMPWPQVSDLKGWNNDAADLYVIRSIPQNVLISPDGTIIDRNLGHVELEARLRQLLEKPA
ncbi:MAG: redoxin domain-containing protein [Bacteroidales bacterium]